MGKLNSYYRGFKELYGTVSDNPECVGEQKNVIKSNPELEVFDATKYLCSIKEDWIIAIEEGLPFIEKAIAEERQFIRADGEVIPIEKVKRVSRASVEHLARHSDMITHVPEDMSNIVPDKLYMVEKNNDYAVYENRFLYMLLVYLNEFIYFRLSKLEELRGSYISNLGYKKEFKSKFREYEVEMKLHEKILHNPYPLKDETSDDLIQRIKDCQQRVNAFLNTNLMTEVSKTPMIKAPIVKTNVLKMNNNFKHCLELYEYISTYEGLGYNYKEVKKNFAPFDKQIAEEMSEIPLLSLFLSYKYGNELEEMLKGEYNDEEQKFKEEAAIRLKERINRLRKRAHEDNKTMEEYMALLEERNNNLERDAEELTRVKNENIILANHIDELMQESKLLRHQIDGLQDEVIEKLHEVNRLNQKYIDDINTLKSVQEQQINDIKLETENTITNLNNANDQKINELVSLNNDKITELNNKHSEEMARLNVEIANKLETKEKFFEMEKQALSQQCENEVLRIKEEKNNTIYELNNKISSLTTSVEEATKAKTLLASDCEARLKENESSCNATIIEKETAANQKILDVQSINDKLSKRNDLLKAEIKALKIKLGIVSFNDDYTSREKFNELEEEFMAFNDFFEQQWGMTKKQIKNDLLSKKAMNERIEASKKKAEEKEKKALLKNKK